MHKGIRDPLRSQELNMTHNDQVMGPQTYIRGGGTKQVWGGGSECQQKYLSGALPSVNVVPYKNIVLQANKSHILCAPILQLLNTYGQL